MSYQVGTACFETLGAAATQVAAQALGQVVPAGSLVYVIDAEASALGSVTYTLRDAAGVAAPVVYVASPTYPECALLTGADAAEIGWMVVAAWVCAWAVLMIRKGL
jgi:hypothetical protein